MKLQQSELDALLLSNPFLKIAGQPAAVASPAAILPAAAPKKRRGVMNKTETRYATYILDPEKYVGNVLDYRFEPIALRLAEGASYTPDFLVILPDGRVEFHEVKGAFIREAAMVRIKVAAKEFPWFRFVMAQWKDGEWNYRTFGSQCDILRS